MSPDSAPKAHSAESKNNQHSNVSLFMSTFTLRYRPTRIVVALISFKHVLLTCMYTWAAFKRIVISPLDGLINLHPLLDSNTPIYSLLSLMRPPRSLTP